MQFLLLSFYMMQYLFSQNTISFFINQNSSDINHYLLIILKSIIMRIKLIKRLIPMDENQTAKYYVIAENEGVADLYTLAKQVTMYSSLSLGDVLNVLENLIDAAVLFLEMGRGVRLGRLGMLRIVLQSEGVDKPEDFNYNLIHRVKLRFTPGVEMKKQLQKPSFEMVK